MRLPWSRPVASTCHLLLLTLLAGLVAAHSSIRDPIGTLFTVQNSTIDTFNHRVTAFSDFDLSFVLYDKYQIKLVLEPNHDIIPKAGVVVTYLGADGTISSQKPMDRMAHRIFKGSAWVRWGDETWSRVGWARVSVRRDGQDPEFEGTFTVDHDAHHILTTRNYLQIKHELDPLMTPAESNMVLYRDSDLIKPEVLDFGFSDDFFKRSLELQSPHRLGCPSDELSFNNMQDHPLFGGNRTKSSESYRGLMPSKLLFTRSDTGDGGNSAGVNLANSIGQASGCPDVRRIAQVGVATDCTYTQALGDRDAIEKHVTSQLNQASRVYESTFNISLSLHNLTVSDSACPNTPVAGTEWNQGCSDAVTINDRLNMFSAWRGQHSGDGNSHWTLLSTCNTGAAVGLAWLGQACVDTSSTNGGNGFTGTGQTVAGANVVVRRPGTNEWQIIAHETGHTFGAVHDCDSQTCQDPINVQNQLCCPRTAGSCDADAAYIMNPSTGPSQSNFSPCTLGNICSAIGRNSVKTSCLVANDKIQPIDGIATCGNGIVEEGEDCDCGGEEGCGNNACCDASTCKFTSGAKCDDSNGRCCQNCQLLPAKTICRASNGDCDLQEVCDGSTSTCPANRAVADGKSCKAADGSTLACASGQCTSRSQQCKDVFDYSKSPTSDATCKMATNGSNACLITCQLPGSQNSCQQLHQNYLDGTPCEILGFCGNVSHSCLVFCLHILTFGTGTVQESNFGRSLVQCRLAKISGLVHCRSNRHYPLVLVRVHHIQMSQQKRGQEEIGDE